MSKHHWHVLGAGAIGCLFSQHLATAGCAVTLLTRAQPQSPCARIRIQENGVTREAEVAVASGADRGRAAQLLVATKAPDIAGALASIEHRIDAETDIVLAANGMGFVEQVKDMLPGNRLSLCITTEGAHRLAPLHVCHAGRGVTRLGSVDGLAQPSWFADWPGGELQQCLWDEHVDIAAWDKLTVNCAINPLTALHQCRNGELGSSPILRRKVAVLCDEIAEVSIARGRSETAEALRTRVQAVIAATANNRSSMLQDVAAGRVTEIDYITGYLVREAKRLGVNTPLNRELLSEVSALHG